MSKTQRYAWKIHQASESDVDTVVALTEAAYREWTRELGAPPVPVTEDYAARIEAGEVCVLDEGSKTLGLIVFETHRDHFAVFSVAVAPEHQGKGAGRYLLDWVESKARKLRLPEIRLYTNIRMKKNIAIYERLGFRETGRRENPLRPGWTIVDMAKALNCTHRKSEEQG